MPASLRVIMVNHGLHLNSVSEYCYLKVLILSEKILSLDQSWHTGWSAGVLQEFGEGFC